jgi:hypothetical protein
MQALALQCGQIQHRNVQPVQTLILEHQLFRVDLFAGSGFLDLLPRISIKIGYVAVVPFCVNGKIVCHCEQPCLGVFKRSPFLQVPAQPQKRLLGKFFSAARVVYFAKKISKNWHPQLLKVRDHLFVERHRRRTILSPHSHNVLRKRAAREIARLKHHLFYYITDAGRFLRVDGNFNAFRVGKPG